MPEADRRVRHAAPLVVAAALAYIPLVLSSPGRVGADTKTYLYLDPSRLLAEASSMWDSDVALGTVTHQNIGYLWPMGPFYWLFDAVGSPDWLAQRLWLGTLLFAAAAGVRFLLRTLDWRGGGVLVAMLAYELSPYVLHYSARISAVLLPWAGLPWMLALTIRAARTPGWRHPSLFALVVLTVGSVNATSLLLVGLAPVLWLLHAAFVERSVAVADAVRAALRIAVATVAVSLWWIAGLVVQGAYSLPVTRYTETYEVVADAAIGPEVLRGLGYWFFYGGDKFGQWIEPSIDYTQSLWLLLASFGLVVVALLAASFVRWRHRSFFVLLVVVGGLTAIGSHPFDAPSPLGRLFKEFTTTDAGLALRSTPRALPMLVLGTAILLGALAGAFEHRLPGRGRLLGAVLLIGVIVANPAMWRARMIEEHLDRDEHIPDYWTEAIEGLDGSGREGRVMEIPGSDFASYRWGNTVDPITPGLLDRGYVARELVPFGSAESAALLTAFDRRWQEDTLDHDAVVPIARLMSVADLVHRADLTFERFRTPRPVPTADTLDRISGLGAGVAFGEPIPNLAGPEQTMRDEVFLATDPSLPHPAPVTAHAVPDPLDVVRLRPVQGGTVVVGDADGLVDAAGAGLLDLDRAVWFGADLAVDDSLRSEVLAEPTMIVVTDTNKKRAKRWGTLRENVGNVERAGEVPLRSDPTDNRLPVFDTVDQAEGVDADDTRTVSVQPGPFTVAATAYGNPVTYTNDDRAVHAVDGDLQTAWVVAAFGEARGERLRFEFAHPVELSEMVLVQPLEEANRHITEVRVLADGRDVGTFSLGPASRTREGERVVLAPDGPASVYDLEITDLDLPVRATYPGVSPVGFAEIRLGPEPAPVVESLRTPVAFVEAVGGELDRHDLAVVLTRERSNQQEPVRGDPEPEMRRRVVLTTTREFELEGAARLSAVAPEPLIDSLIGRDAATDGTALTARSSGRLPGHLRSAASFAFDGDAATAWTGNFGAQAGQWIELAAAGTRDLDGIAIHVVVDENHSVPTVVRVVADGDVLGEFPTGLELSDAAPGSSVVVEVPAGGSAQQVRIEVAAAAERITRDWYSNGGVAMPISFTEVDVFDGLRFGPPADVDTGCRELVQIDGLHRRLRVRGSAADALDRRELAAEGCEPVSTDEGGFELRTASQAQGVDLDQLVLRSPRSVAPPLAMGTVTVLARDDTAYDLAVPASDDARWLVLGQSHNEGWEASVGDTSLGPPVVIDGFANGWRLPPSDDVRVELRWTPQRMVDRALVLSVMAIVIVLAAVVRGRADAGPGVARRPDGPTRPGLAALPLLDRARPTPAPRSWAVMAVTAVVVGGFAALNLPRWPAAALAVAGAGALAVWLPRWWTRPALVAAATMVLAALAVMVEQRRFRHPPDFAWPQQFEDVHVLGVLVLVLLFADYVRSVADPDGDRRR